MHPEIARRAILAGTSEKGVCPECGAPWRRVVERGHNPFPGSSHDHTRDKEQGNTQTHASGVPAGTIMAKRWYAKEPNRTTGWQPTCKCGRTNTVPATVLDPFDDGMYRGDEQVKDYRILQGDVRDVLATLPDESVHCVVTSPPYWGLRDYGIERTVWGGDPECGHEWGTERVAQRSPYGTDFVHVTGGNISKKKREGSEVSQGAYCHKCSAWRGTLGLEPTPGEFVQHMVEIFREVRRVLRRDGTLWLNMGDSYSTFGGSNANPDRQINTGQRKQVDSGAVPDKSRKGVAGLKPKDLVGMPWMVAFALRADGWYLRSAITWCKRAPMPESVTDRPTSATEMIFLLTRSEKYYYDADAVRERGVGSHPRGAFRSIIQERNDNDRLLLDTNPNGANMRNFWLLGPEPYAAAHFATFPTEIPRRAILAGTSERGVCPACGAPWKRVVERDGKPPYKDTRTPGEHTPTGNGKVSGSAMQRWLDEHPKSTVGWQPTCKCGRTNTVPALVLDPFSGAGTTALVALRLGRRAVGIELNPEYIEMSHKRILGDPQAMNLNMELVEMEETA